MAKVSINKNDLNFKKTLWFGRRFQYIGEV